MSIGWSRKTSPSITLQFLRVESYGARFGTLGCMAHYEYQRVWIPAGTDRATAANILTIHALYGEWELSRVRIWPDGRRHIEVRRPLRHSTMPAMPS